MLCFKATSTPNMQSFMVSAPALPSHRGLLAHSHPHCLQVGRECKSGWQLPSSHLPVAGRQAVVLSWRCTLEVDVRIGPCDRLCQVAGSKLFRLGTIDMLCRPSNGDMKEEAGPFVVVVAHGNSRRRRRREARRREGLRWYIGQPFQPEQ